MTSAVPLRRCTGPVISNIGANGPLYTAQVTIGGSQTFSMLADTGSTAVVVAATTCKDCAGITPLYTPGPQATDLHEMVGLAYGAGTVSGDVVGDTARAGSAQTAQVHLLAVAQQNGFFGQKALCETYEGVLGLGTQPAGGLDYFPQVVATQHVQDVFALGLCPSSGSLWLGGFDPSKTTGPVQFTPMTSDGSYEIDLTGISVAGTALDVQSASFGPMVIDSGDPMLNMPGMLSGTGDAFEKVTAAISQNSTFQQIFGGADWFSPMHVQSCAKTSMSASDLDAALPTLTLTFGHDPSVSVVAKATSSYLQAQTDASGTSWCPGMRPEEGMGSSGCGGSDCDAGAPEALPVGMIGDAFLRSSVVIFDRARGRMGFAPHDCP